MDSKYEFSWMEINNRHFHRIAQNTLVLTKLTAALDSCLDQVLLAREGSQ